MSPITMPVLTPGWAGKLSSFIDPTTDVIGTPFIVNHKVGSVIVVTGDNPPDQTISDPRPGTKIRFFLVFLVGLPAKMISLTGNIVDGPIQLMGGNHKILLWSEEINSWISAEDIFSTR